MNSNGIQNSVAAALPTRTQRFAIIATLLAALVPALLWPGDAPWVYDEPAEVRLALQANQQHQLAFHALSGNFGVWYGPLPIQIMQAWLLVTHDPRGLVLLRATLCAMTTGAALLWLGWTLRLNLWFVPAVMLAPHLWLWNRQLWAAYLAVPMSALAVAAYAAFLRSRRGATLTTAIASAIALPLIHPQGLPLTLVILGHALWRHWPALRRHWPLLTCAIVVLVILHARYLAYAGSAVYRQLGNSLQTGHPSHISRGAAMMGSLLGGRLISTSEFNESPLSINQTTSTHIFAVLGCAGIVLVWIGIGTAIHQTLVRRERQGGDDVLRTMLRLVLAGVVVQGFYFALLRVPPRPYYLFGMFGLNALAAWVGTETLARLRLRTATLIVYALALASFSLGTLWLVHRDGWPANQISPTLNEQIDLAKSLNRYSDREAWTNVSTYRDHEVINALWTLRLLYPRLADEQTRESGRLLIRYKRDDAGAETGRIELVELSIDAAPPPNAMRIPLQDPRP
jgi:hypothetical protein